MYTRRWIVLLVTASLVALLPLGVSRAIQAPVESANGTGLAVTVAADRGHIAMTTIALRVNACRHCPVYLQQALDDGTYWTSKTHRVRAGRATFHVPTRRTRGMSFVFNPRWDNVTNARTNVVTRYGQTRAGQAISNNEARHKQRATACWAGTSRQQVRLVVRAVKFRARALGGGPGHALRAWFNPMQPSTPPMHNTFRGNLGNQDAYFCAA
jgi:hypothetical protein